MNRYWVEINYRTNSGGNTWRGPIDAPDMDTAWRLASEKVAKRRGVVKVDGVSILEPEAKP